MSDSNKLKQAVGALAKQAKERLKSKGDPRGAELLIERYNFLLKQAKELNSSNSIIQSMNELEIKKGIGIGEFAIAMEKVTYALEELDSQLDFDLVDFS